MRVDWVNSRNSHRGDGKLAGDGKFAGKFAGVAGVAGTYISLVEPKIDPN
jgi:hypothetical protein